MAGPKVSMDYPSISRRLWIVVEPVYKPGSPKAQISRSPEGKPGKYSFKFALSTPGQKQFHSSVDLSNLANSGETPVVLDADKVELSLDGHPYVLDAHLHANAEGRLTTSTMLVDAENFADAERKAYRFLSPFLSWLSFKADVPIDVLAAEIEEDSTEVRCWIYKSQGQIVNLSRGPTDAISLSGVTHEVQLLQAAYREAMNATNPFYQFLCFWKVVEACRVYRKRNQRQHKAGAASPAYEERIPASMGGSDIHRDDVNFFQDYLNWTFDDVRDSMEDTLRNAVAHLVPDVLLLNPDEPDDVSHCERALPVIKYIARKTLANQVAINARI